MKHLSALDALFLHLETADTPMHVGSLIVLDPPRAARRKSAPGFYHAIREHVAARLHVAPVFSRQLAFMPLDLANPLWVDAPEVDLDFHIQRLALPAPGTPAQLEAAVAKLHEGMLPRDRPLWQFTVIEGLAEGHVGFYAKIHHAALDGQGGVAVAQALLDLGRVPRAIPPPEKARARAAPSALRLLGAALRNTVSQYGKIVKAVPALLKTAGLVASPGVKVPKGVARGPRTPLNVPVGAKRAFATAQIPLAEAKAIAASFGVKLNDVVLATVAGALRRHFAGDKAILAKELIGAVPASLRTPGDTTQANAVTMMLVKLATHIADPARRLAAIHAASSRAKGLTGGLKGVIPTDMPSLGLPWLLAAATPLLRKAVSTQRVPVIANLVVSNVPGPQVPLYLAGAEMLAYYPVSIVTHGLALNVTILSYNGSLDYGLVAGKAAVPRLRAFATHLLASHQELLRLARKK